MRSRRLASPLRLSFDIFYVMLPMRLKDPDISTLAHVFPPASSPPSSRPPICVSYKHSIRTHDRRRYHRPEPDISPAARCQCLDWLLYSPRAALSSSYPAPPFGQHTAPTLRPFAHGETSLFSTGRAVVYHIAVGARGSSLALLLPQDGLAAFLRHSTLPSCHAHFLPSSQPQVSGTQAGLRGAVNLGCVVGIA
ncbi:hypothetical protein L227DRAFT_34399 [Lentinus tigrinus ALCF2SS1-6]|uniref:Uncharacterized protein n=1 Tax=Lentinus tigrinus ALCF2SS1-6 TaxID=1328759 RepID=A0A5C2SGI5_9APHY|nr:hypothetical protein L227DRAFT_34399 [Lentinus tigrinus ALCF2SS1-6]